MAKDSDKKKNDDLKSTIKFLVVTGLAMCLAGLVSLNLYLTSLPPIKNLQDFKPNIVTKFYSHDDEIVKTFTAYTFQKVELKDTPEALQKAIIATEDKNFYRHHGYDLFGIARSMVQNVFAKKFVQGASTITQQLARVLFLSNEKSFSRKIKELVIAARIEKTISKDRILEMYLNNVYLGSGAYGVEAASQIYFNKHLKECDLSELALIAGLPQAPSIYSPFNNMELAVKRRNQVLLRMYKMRYITKDEYEKAKEAKVKLTSQPDFYMTNKAPYFADYVMKELEKLGFDETEIIHGGYKVVTTLDYKTQLAANEAVAAQMRRAGLNSDKQQAAVFSFSPVDGRILAYVGGKNYAVTQFDRVQAIRPPGSSFKPFVYAAALEHGYSPNDIIDDAPVKIGGWTPKNASGKYSGKIPIYRALMISSNVCAARMIQEVGIRAVIQTARVLGIDTPLEYDHTIALGSNGVKLFEFIRAYGAFANGGYVVQPYAIERVETSRGKIVYIAPKTKITHQLSVKTAAEMTAMLKLVITGGTGRSANIGKPAAGKTGTTDKSRDAYFVGYTPNVVTGVWVGNDDNSTGYVYGGSVPALIWRDVMKVATEPYGNVDFNYPEVELNGAGKTIGTEEIDMDVDVTPPTDDPNAPIEPGANVPPMPAPDGTTTTPKPSPTQAVPAPSPAPAPTPASAPIPGA